MKYIADLHVHSSYSIATSKFSHLEGFYQWARIKGINLVGTGDFTHPAYFSEIQEKLEPAEEGFFRLKEPPSVGSVDIPLEGFSCEEIPVRFCLSGEISSIYKKGGRTRKVHSLIFAPDLEVAGKIRNRLESVGNIKSDGRPILGLDPKDMLEMILEISEQACLVPAHVWTPWFSLFGSKSGFDTMEECFEELTPYIFALETGLSSDPEMNRRWSALDRYTLISNSDAHSPSKLGREANLFDTEFSYPSMLRAMKEKEGFLGTLEFFPEEGKYHLDGHRKCGVCLEPEETRRYKGICPECGKQLTVGVMHRVLELSDREKEAAGASDFRYIIPLPEIIAEIHGTGPAGKNVMESYGKIVSLFGSEFRMLLDVPLEEIESRTGVVYREAVRRMREGAIHPQPGYDGEFGVIKVFQPGEVDTYLGQGDLFGFSSRTGGRSGNRQGLKKEPKAVVKKEVFALNEEQSAVTECRSGALLINAGPGTGKTRTLTSWIEALLSAQQGAPPEILAITFTNKAAGEMEARLRKGTPSGASPGVHIATFHSFCYDLIREHNPKINIICDSAKRRTLLKLLLPEKERKHIARYASALERSFESGEWQEDITALRERYLALLEKTGGVDLSHMINRVNALFEKEPAFCEKIRKRYKYIAIDELQDINASQFRLIRYLAEGEGAPCVLAIGDPDQGIYGFRGSDMQLFFRFGEYFGARLFQLNRNYRSGGHILSGAASLISHNRVSGGLQLKPSRGEGERIRIMHSKNSAEEGRRIASEVAKLVGGMTMNSVDSGLDRSGYYSFSDMAVLYRTRAVGESLLSAFRKAGIPVSLRENQPLLERDPFTLVNNFLSFLLNPSDILALKAVIEHFLPGESPDWFFTELSESDSGAPVFLEQQKERLPQAVYDRFREIFAVLESWGALLPEAGVAGILDHMFEAYFKEQVAEGSAEAYEWEGLRDMAELYGPDLGGFYKQVVLSPDDCEYSYKTDKVSFLTFHAAKGLEFPVVFIAGADAGITPVDSSNSDPEEERRLFYVAMTRAEELLYICSAGSREIFHKVRNLLPSPFLAEIPEEVKVLYGEKKRPPEDPYAQPTLF